MQLAARILHGRKKRIKRAGTPYLLKRFGGSMEYDEWEVVNECYSVDYVCTKLVEVPDEIGISSTPLPTPHKPAALTTTTITNTTTKPVKRRRKNKDKSKNLCL